MAAHAGRVVMVENDKFDHLDEINAMNEDSAPRKKVKEKRSAINRAFYISF